MLHLGAVLSLVAALHSAPPPVSQDTTPEPVVIDPRSDSMEYGDHRVHIEHEFIRFESPELYVGSERLGDLLGVMFAVDWSDLTATVVDPGSLPIARRLRREAARDAYLRRADGLRPDLTFGLQRPAWDGVVIDYSLFAPSSDPLAGSTYGFGLGADVGGGSLEMLGQSVGPASGGRTAGSSSCGWAMSRPPARARVRSKASRSPTRRSFARRSSGRCATPAVSSRGGRWRRTAAVIWWPSIRRMPRAASRSISPCATARIRSISSRTGRSARSASSTARTGC